MIVVYRNTPGNATEVGWNLCAESRPTGDCEAPYVAHGCVTGTFTYAEEADLPAGAEMYETESDRDPVISYRNRQPVRLCTGGT